MGIQPNAEAEAVVRHVCITAIANRMYGSISGDVVRSCAPSSEMRSLIGIRLMGLSSAMILPPVGD
jgi:hypothetical protein